MSFVTFENVSKFYQMGEHKIAAANQVSFEIEKGEFAVIVGPSGARQNHGAEYAGRNGYLRRGLHLVGRQ